MDPRTKQYLDTSTARVVSIYSTLAGLAGSPVALVQVDSPRDIRNQGERTVGFFFLWLFIVGAGFCGVVLLTIERTVLSRLMHLGQSLLVIGTGGDATKRIEISGKDQIAYIGAAINGMLDAQARSTEELRASERRNEAFLDAVPDVIFRVTRDGTILDARSPRRLPLLEAADDLVGRDEEMILPLYSFLSPELFDKSIAATAAALDSGQVRGAGVDVYDKEPPEDWSLARHPRVIASPHIGATTAEAQVNVSVMIAKQIGAYLTRGEVVNAVKAGA